MAKQIRGRSPTAASEPANFDVIENPSLRALAQLGHVHRYRRNVIVMQEDDPGGSLFVILAGRLRVYSGDPGGREITYGTYGPGDTLGEMSLDGSRRSANVLAIESSACSVIGHDTLRERFSHDPQLAFELLSRVIQRARLASNLARGMATMDVYGRLVAMLELHAEDIEDGKRIIRERLTHQLIASHIGASRVMITRLINDLIAGGYLTLADHHIVINRRLPRGW